MSKSNLLRLTRITVNGLFGIYDHSINLNLNDRTTLLHGPNGVGKTVILQMINAMLQNRLEFFMTIPLARFVLHFNNGSSLSMRVKTGGRRKSYILGLTSATKRHSISIDWNTRAGYIADQIEYLRPDETSPNMWVDIRDREILSHTEVIDRFGPMIRPRGKHFKPFDAPWYDSFLNSAHSHLIEAQRLFQIDPNPRRKHRYGWRTRGPSMISTVVEYGKDFRTRLATTMADYGRQSQTLDQSFPRRLIAATEELAVEDLQKKMDDLDKRTKEFKDIGILDETPSHPLEEIRLDPNNKTQIRVMTLYVSDTEIKLRALDDLASRTEVFLNNVNKKYRHKKIRLDRENGFVARNDDETKLPLESLSSGEQQELVLNYDLLFRVPSNTIVLIDEPELSLHVAWQKQFLSDLLTIVELSNFDALVATHSPFIVGDRDDLMVGIGDKS